MRDRLPFRYIEPTFFAGLLDDPVLLLHARPLGESCLIECGQIHHLAKRVLKSVAAVFITHAHMDHFMGIDTLIRNVHVSHRTVDIFGPPGVAEKMAHKLSAYDWNLTEPYWCTFRVHEVSADRVVTSLFPGAEGFPRRSMGEHAREDRVIYRNGCLQVEAEVCEHRIPALVFRVTESRRFSVDGGKLDAAGLVGGEWLRELKRRYYAGELGKEPLKVLRRRGDGVEEWPAEDTAALYGSIRREETPAAIGYISDIGASPENLEKVLSLMEGVKLLVCECSFLAEDVAKARESRHLCTADLNLLVEKLRPAYLLPTHMSRSYLGRSRLLYEELEMPPGVTLLRLPEHVAPRPFFPEEVPKLELR